MGTFPWQSQILQVGTWPIYDTWLLRQNEQFLQKVFFRMECTGTKIGRDNKVTYKAGVLCVVYSNAQDFGQPHVAPVYILLVFSNPTENQGDGDDDDEDEDDDDDDDVSYCYYYYYYYHYYY